MCIFCEIAKGNIPSTCLYEDESVFVFKDINPQAPVHFLVIPREHLSAVSEINADNAAIAAKCIETAVKVAKEQGLESYRIITNCGADAGQTVPHLHFHVLGGKKLSEQMV